MADLLTHVLVVYVLLTIASWGVERVKPPWVAVAMGGAAIPDLVKIRILVEDNLIENALGVGFDYAPISSLGGVVLIGGAIAVAFDRQYWRRAYGSLLAGGLSSLVVDGLRVFADGHAGTWLYPLTWWRPPTPSLYVTSDPRVVVGAVLVAGVVAGIDFFRRREAVLS